MDKKAKRNSDIDTLKGIAIIAIILYHFLGEKYFKFGYLGVEVFLVITGYFMMERILSEMEKQDFSCFNFLFDKITRLWLPVVTISSIALIIGMMIMLPDDFENLGESVVASNLFANNILACITTGNYWDVVNIFKPLMHTWYLGLIMQVYFFISLLLAAIYKISRKNIKVIKWTILFLFFSSFIIFYSEWLTPAQKFYYFPARLYEFLIIPVIFIFIKKEKICVKSYLRLICLVILLLLLFLEINFFLPYQKIIFTILLTSILILPHRDNKKFVKVKILSFLGKISLSLFLCHQVIIAFLFYAFIENLNIKNIVIGLILIFFISIIFYFFVEKKMGIYLIKSKNNKIKLFIFTSIFAVFSSIAGLKVYLNAGVFKDIPELDIRKENKIRGIHAMYCDIPYKWDNEFSTNDKVKILVIGDSFGRDFSNILNESKISKKIEISYIYPYSQKYIEDRKKRIDKADLIFSTLSQPNKDIDGFLIKMLPKEKLYIVGYKNFGKSNGIIYNSFKENYYEQSVFLDEIVLQNNRELEKKYGNHFINMISVVQKKDKSIRVFTDDNKFISQDCRHLTKAGAIYYSKLLDLEWIIKKKEKK